MCGIAGYAGLDDESLLTAMCRSLRHRGPDDEGYYREPGAGLAIRRLAVIDLRTGHQPLANETGDVQVVFNGEIYNYQELTERLQQRGHRFATTSDTETIVHLYEDRGLDFVNELRGMFAIALWDARRMRLVLARDRIGEKPLFYARQGPALLFGSEIKALLQARVPRRVDHQAVCEFLAAGYVAPPRTFFADIRKLAPGEMLIFENGSLELRRYWRPDAVTNSTLPFDEACERLADLLEESVRLCLKSDVEVGAFLSGGIDSSVAVALMRRHEAQVQTFSVGYTGEAAGFNELSYARRVADTLGTQHHELILGAHSSLELLPRILWHFDEPHGEPTSVLVYLLSEFTRERVKVAVGGTGGDELFLGYPRHIGLRLRQYYRLLPGWFRREVLARTVARWPESTRGSRFAKRARRFVNGADLPTAEAYLGWVSLLSREVRDGLLADRVRAGADDPTGEAFLRAYLSDERSPDPLVRASALDVGGYLPEYQLCYMDRMSMAHGLEVRSPLCDYQLVQFVSGLPGSYRLHRTHGKHILKRVARRWIPQSIAERPKVGFDSPIGQWAKDELRPFFHSFLSREQIQRTGLLNPEAVQTLLADHLSGRRDYSLPLWSLLALEAWHRMYVEDGITDGSAYSITELRGADGIPAMVGRATLGSGGATDQAIQGNGSPMPPRVRVPHRPLLRRHLWDHIPTGIRHLLKPVVERVSPARLLGKEFRRNLALAEASERWDPETLRSYQLEKLRAVCLLAYERSPFYRDRFQRAGFDPRGMQFLSDFLGAPTIDRRDVSAHLESMCTINPNAPGVDRVSTGGTNGEPLSFYINADRSSVEYAFLVASWRRCGYAINLPLAILRSRVVAPDGSGLRHDYDPILRHHYYSAFHMTEGDMRSYVEHLRTLGSCFLHVYPSSVASLATFVERFGEDAPSNIRGIIAESEIVYPEQRRFVEDVFHCRYFSCYGHSEKLVLAAECEHSTNYHVWPTYGYFELLDEDGRPVATPGQRGEIVGTGFINTVSPFIRYRTGDFATYVDDRCVECGRYHPLIRDIRGHRIQELLVLADGSSVSWTALNVHDDTFRHVRRFQFYQERPGEAVLRVIPTAAFGGEDPLRIVEQVKHKLGDRLKITVERVEAISLSPRGKAIYVDQRIAAFGDGLRRA